MKQTYCNRLLCAMSQGKMKPMKAFDAREEENPCSSPTNRGRGLAEDYRYRFAGPAKDCQFDAVT